MQFKLTEPIDSLAEFSHPRADHLMRIKHPVDSLNHPATIQLGQNHSVYSSSRACDGSATLKTTIGRQFSKNQFNQWNPVEDLAKPVY